MPSTQESGGSSSSKSSHRSSIKQSDFVCRVKYGNTLPDVPFDPKFLVYPFEQNRYVQYKPTTLERGHKHELLTEVDLGVPIDLIDPRTYAADSSSTTELHPVDEMLLEDEVSQPANDKRARQHNKHVSWLRKTEYISSEYNRFQTSSESLENKVGYSVKKKLQGEDVYKDRKSQIAAIEKTFTDAQRPITKHHSKPNVTAKEILPVFPDFQLWQHPFAQVSFDNDPSPSGKTTTEEVESMAQAMLRGMVDESGNQFVAYFLPSTETKKRRREEGDDFPTGSLHEYEMQREYNWKIRTKSTHASEEIYFFTMRPGEGVFYNELATRVRLSKRRAVGSTAPRRPASTKLTVKQRNFEETELASQGNRLMQLEPVVAEEDDEEEEEEGEQEEEEEQAGDNDDDGDD
eukprot:scpid87147/ scgid15415/ RNA polymerase II-associated factor 1 homolog